MLKLTALQTHFHSIVLFQK
uniref:Uncharacterized protein n=1 Tax=Arundo donax TaxID=35708 RepID=A0A0A9F8F4_ARUDO